MANRQQRRAGAKLLNKPELKEYIDKFCMDISNLLVDSCEVAKNEAQICDSKIDFSKIQDQLEDVMKSKGEELGKKVQDVVKQSNKKPVVVYGSYKA